MVIISKNEKKDIPKYSGTQFRYGVIYLLITFAVLFFLNVYCSNTSQKLFYRSKQSSMQDKAQLVAYTISELDVVNADSVKNIVDQLENLTVTRLIVTNQSGLVLYDSLAKGSAYGVYTLYPEIVQALQGNDVFTWRYHDGVMESQAAAPILSYDTLAGAVYIMEYDSAQGQLIKSLQMNLLTITVVLELVLTLFSLAFSRAFSSRMRKIISSIQIIREGDYTHKVELHGTDELAVLGRQFNDLTDRLCVSENKRRQFVSDASHELKTPLASIKLLSDTILQNDMDIDTIREFVADIGDEADRLNRMSAKLLSLTRVNTDSEADCEIVYMRPTIARVVRMLSAIADHSAITIKTDIITDCSILIQEDDLYQIVFNLVENGIKYNIPGGKIYIELTRQEDNAVLTVRDTGVGIPEDSIEKIFERFYRVDKARARQTGGSGLGLAIVRDMVARNRGEIHVESQVGDHSGTTFTLVFPVFDVEEDEP